MRVARCGIAAVLVFTASAQTDFRQAIWGMTPAQVRASETNRPNRERESNREFRVHGVAKENGLGDSIAAAQNAKSLEDARDCQQSQHGWLGNRNTPFKRK